MDHHVLFRLLAIASLALLVLFLIPEAARSAVVIAAAVGIVALRQPRVHAWTRAHLGRPRGTWRNR